MNRELQQEEKWLDEYERLVDLICRGYGDNIYEYTNDLSCRLFIQQVLEKNGKDTIYLSERLERADNKLKSVLQGTKACIHGDYPKSYFCLWGIPKNSKELEDEARSMGWL